MIETDPSSCSRTARHVTFFVRLDELISPWTAVILMVHTRKRRKVGDEESAGASAATGMEDLLATDVASSSVCASGPEVRRRHQHQGFTFLDVQASASFVAHTLTLEKKPLPTNGDWSIIFDDEGFGALVDASDTHDVILLEEYLARRLEVDTSGELWVSEELKNGTRRDWSLSQKRLQFIECTAVLKAGPTLSPHVCSAFLLTWPQQGSRFFWQASCLYKHLQFTAYGNEPSWWFSRSNAAWRLRLSKLGFSQSQCMHSTNSKLAKALPDSCFLPSGALSTVALLFLLNDWAEKICGSGGRKDATTECDAAARLIIDSLVRCANNGVTWHLQVRCMSPWTPPWPRPEPRTADFSLVVHAEATLDLSDWRRYAFSDTESEGQRQAHIWWCAAVHDKEHDTTRYPLSSLLQRTGQKPVCSSLHSQLLSHTATKVEVALLTSLKKGLVSKHSVDVKVVDIMAILMQPRRLNLALFKHVLGGVEASRSHSFISLTTDKANIWGPHLQAGAFVLPNNQAFLAVPQVL